LPNKSALLRIFVGFCAFSPVFSADLRIRFASSRVCCAKSYAFANKFAHLIRKIRQFSPMARKLAFDSENSQQPTAFIYPIGQNFSCKVFYGVAK